MTEEIERRPTRIGTYLSLALALLVTVFALPYSGGGAVFGGLGLTLLVAALTRGWRRIADLGGLALAVSVVLTGVNAPPPSQSPVATLVVLGAAVATVLAWDTAINAIGLGEQLGVEAETTRAEASHFLGSLAVGVFVSVVGFGLYQGAGPGQPVTAVVFMLVAMLVLISALRL